MKKTIIHVSEVDISTRSGMGRVEYYWKKAFEEKGYSFIHIGPAQLGHIRHKALFPYMAYRYFKTLNVSPAAFIIHEPAAGAFVNHGIPCFVESHGIERKYWDLKKRSQSLSFRTKLFYPLWRLRLCDKGLKKAEKLLIINSEDKDYVIKKYNRDEEDIFLFKNGIEIPENIPEVTQQNSFTILFNGSWIERKGIRTLIEAANILHGNGLFIQYLLIGTGKDVPSVLSDWPDELKDYVRVIPGFTAEEEIGFLSSASIFVLPSLAEGQPLSLLQAMAVKKCCITTNCCGQKDIIENGINGLLYQPGDAMQLAELIKKCYENKQMTEAIGLAAYESVKKRKWTDVSEELATYVISNII